MCNALASCIQCHTALYVQLRRDIATYFGYNEFMTAAVLDLFSPAEALEFLEANEVPACVLPAFHLQSKAAELHLHQHCEEDALLSALLVC